MFLLVESELARTRNRARHHFNQIYGGTVKMRPVEPWSDYQRAKLAHIWVG